MAFKINIRPDIDAEMDTLIKKSGFRSKTDYINNAVMEFNLKIKRELELSKLKTYFSSYRKEADAVMKEFGKLRSHED